MTKPFSKGGKTNHSTQKLSTMTDREQMNTEKQGSVRRNRSRNGLAKRAPSARASPIHVARWLAATCLRGFLEPLYSSNQTRYGGAPQPFFNPHVMGYPKHQLSSKSETLDFFRFLGPATLTPCSSRTRGDETAPPATFLIGTLSPIQNTNSLRNRRHSIFFDVWG